MTAALPILMCHSIVGETAHEVIGIAMFVLFILHHILNFGWIKSLFKGKYCHHPKGHTPPTAAIFDITAKVRRLAIAAGPFLITIDCDLILFS